MTCSVCKRPATDNACAYYRVVVRKDPEQAVTKCWFCMNAKEKVEQDHSIDSVVRFKLLKTLEHIKP